MADVATAIEVDVILVLHIRQTELVFCANSPMLRKLIGNAGLQGNREWFAKFDTVFRIFRVGIDAISVVSNAEREHGAKSDRPRILAVADVVLRNDRNVNELEMLVICTIFR